jgi:thioredoxin-like negative regulator of GroEL
MYKKDEKKITPVASTSVDPNLRAILDMMQHQNEEYQAAVNNLYKLIREEGAQGMKEIELIGKTMTEFELGDTSEFNSIITLV